MPQFVMENTNEAVSEESPFVYGFIEAMFFTESASGTPSDDWFSDEVQEDMREGRLDGCLPGDVGYCDIHPDSLAAIRADCEAWQAANAGLLSLAYERPDYDEAQAGRDYWFTRNGHGVGFWDRDALESSCDEWQGRPRIGERTPEQEAAIAQAKAESLGERLSDACRYSEVNPFFGEHVTHGNAPFVHVDL